MLVGLRQRADGEQVPVGSDGMVHADVVNRESVGVRVKFDLAGAIEGKVFEAEVLHRANADTEIVVTAEFEIRLVIDFEMPNVGKRRRVMSRIGQASVVPSLKRFTPERMRMAMLPSWSSPGQPVTSSTTMCSMGP